MSEKPRSIAAQRHADWIGMLQPEGLVVSVAVLEELGLYVRQELSVQQRLRELTPDERLPDLDTLLYEVLGWKRERVQPPGPEHTLDLSDLGITLRPDAVAADRKGQVQLLIRWLDGDLDAAPGGDRWAASHTERFERLLSRREVPVGLMVNPGNIRLIYAPAGQAPGRLTFPVEALRTSDGRLLVDALHMLLGSRRLFSASSGQRLGDVLKASRERQEKVTEALAAQVEDALRVLLDGFDTADARARGALLQGVSGEALYDGLSTVLLRLIFVLYAEDRGLLPMEHPVYGEHYSVVALGEQLARDAVAHGEAQSRRYGGWARLVSLFRMIWSGAHHPGLDLPARQGDLFHPDRFPFLEGRPPGSSHTTDPVRMPPVDDAVLRETLDRLLHLEGQRISYRNLEVEQIGSVYEALMGFAVQKAATRAVALSGGVFVEVGALAEAEQPMLYLQEVTGERNARLRKQLPELNAWRATGEVEADRAAVEAGLGPLRDRKRGAVPAGRHYLQPGSARRGSGSHYTPRSLTEPIVRRTLAPLLGEAPSSERILGLKVCDPAMGSGAFLAEACRQLAEALVEAWGREGVLLDTTRHDPVLQARRKVSERCLYGVDKNPRAVQLARLSLWLITSAADLPFTFVDHALREGDALVGLSLRQIAAFDFHPGKQVAVKYPYLESAMGSAARTRAYITKTQREMLFERDEHRQLTNWLTMADDEVWDERRVGDLLVACAWAGGTKGQVAKRIARMGDMAWGWYPAEKGEGMPGEAEALLEGLPMRPFHWWLEYPEVFQRKNPGFDAVIGNPPFGGQETIRQANGGAQYIKLLQTFWPHAHGNSDLAAYFFLKTAHILKKNGTFGLISTNTISQGSTRETGLKYLLANDCLALFFAETDIAWPVAGVAVVVSVVNGFSGNWEGVSVLDGEGVSEINSALEAGIEVPDPVKLVERANQSFLGNKIYGQGFILDTETAENLISERPDRNQVIFPYIGGQELNSNVPDRVGEYIPHNRCVVNFAELSLVEAAKWPELFKLVKDAVKPERDRLKDNADGRRRKKFWWQFGRRVPALEEAVKNMDSCFACSIVTKHLLFAVQPANIVFSHKACVIALNDWFSFAVLQSYVHEFWARAESSTHELRLSYTPSRCFETFPFPRPTSEQKEIVSAAGEALYTLRQELMVREQQGMTQIWNRMLDPHETDPDFLRLRERKAEMDRAVLDAYGWSHLAVDDREGILKALRKLNAERAREEAAQAAEAGKKGRRKKT